MNFVCANCGKAASGLPRGPRREEWCVPCWRTLPDGHILRLDAAVDDARDELDACLREVREAEYKLNQAVVIRNALLFQLGRRQEP